MIEINKFTKFLSKLNEFIKSNKKLKRKQLIIYCFMDYRDYYNV